MSGTPNFNPTRTPPAFGGRAARHSEGRREQSALLKGGRSLLSMNQPDGFDCPGWAS